MSVKLIKPAAIKEKDEKENEVQTAVSQPITSEASGQPLTANNSGGSLGDAFAQIDKKYSSDLFAKNEVPSLDKLSLYEKNADEIEHEAKTSLEEYRVNNQNSINNSADNKLTSLNTKQAATEKAYENNILNAKDRFESNVQSIKAAANKKGLSRSSIVENAQLDNQNAKLQTLNNLKNSLSEQMGEINRQISVLNAQRDAALQSFDIAYAARLDQKIASLNADYEKKNNDIIKYNNTLAQQQAKLQEAADTAMLKQFADYAKIRDSNTKDYFADLARAEKMQAAYDYLLLYSKEEALDFAKKNADLKQQLGNYYDSLIARLSLREV